LAFPLEVEVKKSVIELQSPESKAINVNFCSAEFQKVKDGFKIEVIFASGASLEYTATASVSYLCFLVLDV
jgi:hypothetical protein